ncbi:B3/B4 domain-containing protein [Rothia terrae]|uniref:B3/B4 domain-containing protein n=1 Tax=Rothia terrae TaxID=396015 RepID=UPI00288275F2|nr:phenylalanine--tRNA ligase beta subunit-related protein [Rothia terrae]MDT0190741.1 phenylalanine--tRNA ligase beta subunit-related protein [Rothia terrae]
MNANLREFLDQAYVADEIFELRPDYRALLIAVDGIEPGESNETSEAMLVDAENHANKLLEETAVTELPHIADWREAYKAFGAKPSRTRNSLEALTRRAAKGLPRVNRLTDIYNAISVKHQIPLGGEDIDKYVGALHLVRATGEEDFATFSAGEPEIEHPEVGEVIWRDDESVTCRLWNWRQCARTGLTDQTTTAVFILDALGALSDEELQAAGAELAERVKELGTNVTVEQRLIAHNV